MASRSRARSKPGPSTLPFEQGPRPRRDRGGRHSPSARTRLRGRRRRRLRSRRFDRPVRRHHRPLGDKGDGGSDRARGQPQGDRTRRSRHRQRRRRRGHAARNRRRERAGVDGHLRGRAHDRPARRADEEHPAGACGTQAGPVGAEDLRRSGAGRQDARRARLRPDRPAGRPPCRRARDAGHRVRPLRVARAVSRARGRAGRKGPGRLRRR